MKTTKKKPIKLAVSRTISNIKITGDGYALGILTIAGVPHHAQFIRVKTLRDGTQVADGKSPDAQHHWPMSKALYELTYQTISLPGQKGRWVCIIHPHSRSLITT